MCAVAQLDMGSQLLCLNVRLEYNKGQTGLNNTLCNEFFSSSIGNILFELFLHACLYMV